MRLHAAPDSRRQPQSTRPPFLPACPCILTCAARFLVRGCIRMWRGWRRPVSSSHGMPSAGVLGFLGTIAACLQLAPLGGACFHDCMCVCVCVCVCVCRASRWCVRKSGVGVHTDETERQQTVHGVQTLLLHGCLSVRTCVMGSRRILGLSRSRLASRSFLAACFSAKESRR